MSERYPTPTWLERVGVEAMFRRFGTRKPSTQTLLDEMEDLKAGVAEGTIEWPPMPELLPLMKGTPAEYVLDEWSREPAIDQSGTFTMLPSVRPFAEAMCDPEGARLGHVRIFDALRQYWHQEVLWEAYGRQVYILDATTAEMLAQTDLPDMPFGELRAPLPAFYLRMPPGTLPSTSDGMQPEGLLVKIGESSRLQGGRRTLEFLALPSPEDDHDFLPTYLTCTAGVNEPLPSVGLGSLRDREFKQALARTVFGFCLYLMTDHPHLEAVEARRHRTTLGVSNPKKRQKIERDNRTKTRLGFVYVGRGESPAAEASSPASGSRRAHWVRGHWRNQAHGPGHVLRRLKWIRPHLRGGAVPLDADPRAQVVQEATRAAA